ncbi:MAG: ABC transporter ATP-binding protein [Rhodobacterales bacterium RIFCSPHIGHO2_02_FULL_62_130]|nr:MAG: ABC transporter ATP-binding protein [Rhodobacterales bacterium RIFCSPHIGHO2_02_FULL_62_130]OHC60212.1 MAG: ABC transporter ATP-binding protein [Rhodobacterales bacterium RIFCSPHIGHO2_12_FULL_62_75]
MIDICICRSDSKAALFAPISLHIPAGEVACVMGPSGVGKSTLLDGIGGHLAHDFKMRGRVLLEGRDVTQLPPETRRIGLMFQDALLFPHLSLGDNLAFGLPTSLQGRAARRAAVDMALDQAGLAGLYDRDPATLSGGQRARAALMRTLLAEPLALLLDEPFSKLDPALRDEMRRFTFAHVRTRAIPALMVSHDPEDAAAAGGAVVALLDAA